MGRIRVHKLLPGKDQGPAMVMEVEQSRRRQADGEPAAKASKGASWTFVRIASLRSGEKPWRMGPFAACPMEQKGGKAVFRSLELGPKVQSSHSSDPGHHDVHQ